MTADDHEECERRIAALTQDRDEARAALARIEEQAEALDEMAAMSLSEDVRAALRLGARSIRAALAAPAPAADQAQGGDLP